MVNQDHAHDGTARWGQRIVILASYAIVFALGTHYKLLLQLKTTSLDIPREMLPSHFPGEVDFFGKIARIGWSQIDPVLRKEDPLVVFHDGVPGDWSRGSGGLQNDDRALLFKVYGAAESVFEFGLGESTKIAEKVMVPRYAGIDSDPAWVSKAARSVSNHFRFYLADLGPTGTWGFPQFNLTKNVYDYQLAPLVAELEAFDVYMVDGRYRFGCLMASFLHAASRGANRSKTTVLVHDCWTRADYHRADQDLYTIAKSSRLCVYRRKPETTDETLFRLWTENMLEVK